MDQQDAIAKARQFADTAYGVAVANITREFNDRLRDVQAQLAARGLFRSGTMTSETARIQGERITALLQARLDSLLEGYELHGVLLDEKLTTQTATEITGVRNTMISQATTAAAMGTADVGIGGSTLYVRLLEQNVGMYQNVVKTQLERRRLMKKPEAIITNIYHVHGHNARWVTNSSDQSVNVVTLSREQIFVDLQQQIETHLPEGGERNDILEKLKALSDSQSSPSFSKRYTDFIAAAANHMALIGPFIPALTELLHKTLG
jgi:hypothetical protein